MWPLNCEDDAFRTYLTFHTKDCIGTIALPGTGHPDEYNYILAHYDGIQSLDLSPGQNLLVTSTKNGYSSIFLWNFDGIPSKELGDWNRFQGRTSVEEFKSLFYYVQLQDPSQLTIQHVIRLPLIIDFTRACGVFISQRQIQELYDEQCIKKSKKEANQIKIDFHEAMQIFYNHFFTDADESLTQILGMVFDAYQSPKTKKLNLPSLINLLVTEFISLKKPEIIIQIDF